VHLFENGFVFELICQLIEAGRVNPRMNPTEERSFDDEPLTYWFGRSVGQTTADGAIEGFFETLTVAVHGFAKHARHILINRYGGSHAYIMMHNLDAVKMRRADDRMTPTR
jgi:hypothetical protein